MVIEPGAVVILDVEKPAAGGRMLARHEGQIVLVWSAIPGERVSARIERTAKGVAFADTIDVLSSSPDRRAAGGDWRCGGNVFAHVAYPRQLQLKGEIIQDAFGRIGRHPLQSRPDVIGSPEHGYRMRARLHAQDGRLGFYREGTHQLCDAGATGQLLPATQQWIAAVEQTLLKRRLAGLAGVEIAENIAGDVRACHLDLSAGANPAEFAPLAETLAGLSAQRIDQPDVVRISGVPAITDVLHLQAGGRTASLTLRRDVRAFFQGNRYLLEPLVRHVATRVPEGPVVDLYAGVGVFGLSLAALGAGQVTLVEGDPVSGADLQENAAPFGSRARVERRGVEAYLVRAGSHRGLRSNTDATFIVDPPRTGLSKDALSAMVALTPARIVYVSCDVPTLARDARALIDAGYGLGAPTGFDLFPNTAHVETVAVFTR